MAPTTMATNKPSGKSASTRAPKKPKSLTAIGPVPATDVARLAGSAPNPGRLDGATTSERPFADGVHNDGLSRAGAASDGASRNGVLHQRTADGAVTHDGAPASGARKPLKISTVSHTLDAAVADRLRHFAFRERISESAVIEFALRELFSSAPEDVELGQRLREAGAALRRKT